MDAVSDSAVLWRMAAAERIRAIQPVLKKRTPTGWFAISETLAPLRIAVVGDSEDHARERFNAATSNWAALQEQPDPFWGQPDLSISKGAGWTL